MADWKNIESYANQIVNKAVPEKDRHKAAENIFFLAAELACAADGPSREGLGWDGSWGIITRDLKEAEAVAGFFDKVFGERVCVTGEWNEEEDKRSGTVDEYTGHGYVKIW